MGVSGVPSLGAVALLLACMVGALFAQTFQYSRGWTNGRKRSQPQPQPQPQPRDAACQLQKLRSILEGRPSPQLYWPCDWQLAGGLGGPAPLDYDATLHHGGPGGPSAPQAPAPLIDMDSN